MPEIVVNLHMHTRYSDGSGSHGDIAQAALRAGLEAVIVTDHNVLVHGAEGYIYDGQRRVLMLIGEEIHDQDRVPQKNHLLVFGANQDLAHFADEPAMLIKAVRDAGALSFIAHPSDPAAPAFGETDISWEDWSVSGFTGLELWNGLSELKTLIPTRVHAILYALFPSLLAHAPIPATVRKWDELLLRGRVVAIGGSDAHALRLHMGPLSRLIYPYEFHFRAINTHVMLPQPLSGNAAIDRRLIYDALAAGNCFVGYDLPRSTRGFRFVAKGRETSAIMGDEISCIGGVTLQAHFPAFADIRLIKDGKLVRRQRSGTAMAYIATEPGVYRIEGWRRFRGLQRGWIFSNPIYLR